MPRRMLLATMIAGVLALSATPALAEDRPEPGEPEPFYGSLYIEGWEFRGGNGDGVPDPGERLELFVILGNGTEETIRDIAVVLRNEKTEYTTVVTARATWPDLGPGESARNETPFVIEIDADAPRQEGCPPMMGDEPVSSGDEDPDGSVVHDVDDRDLVIVEPDQVEPDQVEPDQGGAGEPGSAGDTPSDDGREPAPASPPIEETTEEGWLSEGGERYDESVHLALTMTVGSRGNDDTELYLDTGIVCAFMTDGGAVEDESRAADGLPVAAPEGITGSGVDRATAIASSAVLLGALGAIFARMALRRRKMLA